MLLSVIIPTYNRVNIINFTLDSLDKRYHPNVDLEIIVIDDGSTDGTWSFIEMNYPHVKLVKNTSKGAGAARNTGLAAATGQYINYLDSDDLIGENYFLKKLEFLQQNPEINACYGAYDFFKSDTAFDPAKIIFKHKYPLIPASDRSHEHLINYLGGNFLPPNTIIWQRDFLLRLNGHDTSLQINQDVDLFIRAIFNGLKIAALDDGTKVYIRDHDLDTRVGNPKNAGEKLIQMLALRKKVFTDLPTYGYAGPDCYRALSLFLFNYWKILRHTQPAIAQEYLNFAKEVYWPVKVKGNIGYRMLAKILGPVNAVNMKYFLLKRD